MLTNNKHLTFGLFFLMFLVANITGVAIFYWVGTPTEQAFVAVDSTQLVTYAAIVLVSIVTVDYFVTTTLITQACVQEDY